MKRIKRRSAGKVSDRVASAKIRQKSPPPQTSLYGAIAQLLGGRGVFKQVPMTGIAFHEAILNGFPVKALTTFLNHTHISRAALAEMTGISRRMAIQRSSSATSRLSPAQSSRLW